MVIVTDCTGSCKSNCHTITTAPILDLELFRHCGIFFFSLLCILSFRLFGKEVDSSKKINIKLGIGIGAFQGLTNIALNGKI